MPAYDDAIDLAGDIAFQDADDFEFGVTFCDALGDISTCPFVGSQAADGDKMQSAVGCPITASVQSMADRFSRRGW